MSLNDPQPAPKPGQAQHTVDALIDLLRERKAMGLSKYGVAHQHDNGRDHLVDALQESLDLNVYLMAEVMKSRCGGARAALQLAVDRLHEAHLVISATHAHYCTAAWVDRGLHATECLLPETDGFDAAFDLAKAEGVVPR